MLSWLAELIKQPTIHQLLVNPTYDTTTQSEIVLDFSQNKLNNVGQNFVRILGKNHRLTVLPDIQILFERYVAETNQRINATVTSAIQLNENNQCTITQALKQKFNRDVQCQFKIDPALIGGVMIHIGDKVIDGSLRGRLRNLRQAVFTTI